MNMEATKKKKAYLKPEMSAFEVKTQEFIAGSKTEVEIVIPEAEYTEGLLHSKCTDNGTAFNQLVEGGDCQEFGAQHLTDKDCGLWGKMLAAGLDLHEKGRVIVCRKYNDANGNRVYHAKLVN